MTEQRNNDDFEHLLDEAALWVSRTQGKTSSAKQQQALAKWIDQSPKHRQAYREMLDTWDKTSKMSEIPSLKAEAEYLSKRRPATNASMFKTVMIATAASIMLFVGTLGFKLINQPAQTRSAVAGMSYATNAGELQEIQLPDGSVITLNTRSRVEMSFDDQTRALTLLKGEAYFEVAHDPSRPFIVKIGQSTVRAVGTAFNIYKKPSETVVTITEGIVEIKSNGADRGLEVDASHRVSVGRSAISSVLNADLDSELAWQDRQLIFRDAPLREVLQELNRYLDNPVSIRKSSLPSGLVSGTFDVDEPEEILKVLIDNFQLLELADGNRRVLSAS